MLATNGDQRQLLDFDGDFLVLEIDSITCPLFQSRSKHHNIDGKISNACALQFEDKEGRTILIDDLDGHAHVAYGSFPNAVFIINKKIIALFIIPIGITQTPHAVRSLTLRLVNLHQDWTCFYPRSRQWAWQR